MDFFALPEVQLAQALSGNDKPVNMQRCEQLLLTLSLLLACFERLQGVLAKYGYPAGSPQYQALITEFGLDFTLF